MRITVDPSVSPILAIITMKFFLVATVLVAAVAAKDSQNEHHMTPKPSLREGRVFPDLHETQAFPDFREALYRPMKLAPDYKRGLFR